MKVSVVLPSYRVGGLDVSFPGLGNQTFKDYEVIFVDALYDWRKQLVQEYAQETGVPLKHIPPKKDTVPLHAPNNFENTGILSSSGELIIMFGDYQYAPPDWIQRHWEMYEKQKNTIIMGSLDIYDHPLLQSYIKVLQNPQAYYAFLDRPLDFSALKISVFEEMFKPEMFKTAPLLVPDARGTIPRLDAHYTWVILKNDAVPIEIFENLNGLDEGLDFGSGYQDTDFAFRALKAGYKIFFYPPNKVSQVNHRTIIPPLKRLYDSKENEVRLFKKMRLIEEGRVSLFASNEFIIKEQRKSAGSQNP
jgi:glycosyltransferase involved in cell wall biosynthesis